MVKSNRLTRKTKLASNFFFHATVEFTAVIAAAAAIGAIA